MTKRLYLDEARLAEIGMDAATIATIRKLTEFVALVTQTDTIDQDLTTLSATVAAEQALLDAAQADINNLEDGTTVIPIYVQKDQEAAPAFTAYAGQTVSNPPTQAEVQAIDDAVEANATAIASILTKLQSIEAFS